MLLYSLAKLHVTVEVEAFTQSDSSLSGWARKWPKAVRLRATWLGALIWNVPP